MNRIAVSSFGKSPKKFEKGLEITVRKALKILKKKGVEAEIYLVSGRKMRLLNKKFRGKDKTTDVLSFKEPRNFILPPSKFRKIGEIYLNFESDSKLRIHPNLRKTRKQTLSNLFVDSDKFVDWHRYLLVHGLLHLLGYAHEKKNDTIKMEKKESSVIKKLSN